MTKKELLEKMAKAPDDAEIVVRAGTDGRGDPAYFPVSKVFIAGTDRDEFLSMFLGEQEGVVLETTEE
jgi:hypothetical protein